MTWIYEQITGKMFDPSGMLVGFGYSGMGIGKNNPMFQDVADVGPIPCGIYTIGSPRDTLDHGPFVLPLTPDSQNDMFGRSGFLVHGDSLQHPGMASTGCIIMARSVRDDMATSQDKTLQVVKEYNPPVQV